MGGVVAVGAALLINGFDLSLYFPSIDIKADQDMKDTTALGSTGAKTYAAGLANRTISGDGFFAWNPADDTLSIKKLFDDAISATVDRLITIGRSGATQGLPAVLLNTKIATLDAAKTKVGDLISTSFQANVTTDGATIGYADGIWLFQGTVTGASNGAAWDNTVTNLTGWIANIHNTDADGTLSGKIQHSTDGSTWVDLVTVTALAKNSAMQSVNIGTPVREFWRWINTGIGGTTNKASVAVKIGYTG